MILFYVVGSVALLLNLAGRLLIIRHDPDMSVRWRRALQFLPGAELCYLLFRWEKARLGCIICGLSIAMLVPVANHFLSRFATGKFASVLVSFGISSGQHAMGGKANNAATLKSFVEHKEAELNEVNQHLAVWYRTLTIRQEYLCDEMPEETLEYNRMAAAYQDLMRVWKAERQETDALKSRL